MRTQIELAEEMIAASMPTTGARLVLCRCPQWSGEPCSRTATQEDFLCDPCREGCSHLMFATGPEDAMDVVSVEAHAPTPKVTLA